jgi:hypothetical protein
LTAVGLLVGLAAAPVGAASTHATSCTGSLPPGTYGSITVPTGATCVVVGPVVVLGGVLVSPGASFLLGVEYSGLASGTINGGIVADHAAQVQVYNALIHGAVSVQGGSGAVGFLFTDFSDDKITGEMTIEGYNGVWLGFLHNHVNGTVRLTNNTLQFVPFVSEADVGDNVVHGSLLCSGNVPLENTGGSPGTQSQVTGLDTCNDT